MKKFYNTQITWKKTIYFRNNFTIIKVIKKIKENNIKCKNFFNESIYRKVNLSKLMFIKNFLIVFFSTLGMITSIGVTIDSDNKAYGQSVIDGTPGNDYQRGTPYSDTITGYGGNDRQYGLGGNDYLYGDQQSVYGSTTTSGGSDTQYGGDDSDVLYGDAESFIVRIIIP